MRYKKGFGMTVDAIISLTFIMIMVTVLIGFRFNSMGETTSTSFRTLHFLSEDILEVLNKKGVLDTIGEEWTEDNETGAALIAQSYLDDMVPPNMGYKLIFDNRTVVENQRVSEDGAIAKTHSTRLLAGYAKNKTTLGSVSRAFLTGIQEKITSVYAYFGGLVGMGNITRYLDVPVGASISEAYMEMNAGSDFELYINGAGCNNPHSPAVGGMSANVKEDITPCNFNAGNNLIEIIFTDPVPEEWYIGGGFIKVTYNTSEFNETGDDGDETYHLPGVDGFVDYYSSIYVPGTLNGLTVHLEFLNNYSTYMRIGDVLVYNSTGDTALQTVDLSNSYLEGRLNYNALSQRTIPIKIGTGNASSTYESGNADVILITDLSESMRYRLDNISALGVVRGCGDAQLLDDDTRRISLAKCLDRQFVDIVLNLSGNRVGLVGFDEDSDVSHSLSTDATSLKAHIDSYTDDPSGGGCICCAINHAYDMLNSQSQPGKDKYIIVMSDSVPTHCCGISGWWWWASCVSTGTSINGQFLECPGLWSDCGGALCDGAISNAIWSSQRAHDDFNATVNSIGFGPVMDCYNGNYTLDQIAVVGGGSYCRNDTGAGMQNCYTSFASDILTNSRQPQKINITGGITRSTLSPASYISYQYSPTAAPLGYGEMSISYNTDRFNDNTTCEGSFFISPDVTVLDAKLTSFSSEHWTDYSHIGNSLGTRVAYRLSDFGEDYDVLGDPFIVNIRPDYINGGENNTVKLMTGDSTSTPTGCSVDNRAILTVKMSGSTGYGDALSDSDGCSWDMEFSDGSTASGGVPISYNGSNICEYTSSNQSYAASDSVADSVYRLLEGLDIDDDGKVDVKFSLDQISLEFGRVGGVRSLWGPAQIKLVMWI